MIRAIDTSAAATRECVDLDAARRKERCIADRDALLAHLKGRGWQLPRSALRATGVTGQRLGLVLRNHKSCFKVLYSANRVSPIAIRVHPDLDV